MNAWLSTLRVRTLPAAAVPVLVGAAHAWHLSAGPDPPFSFHLFAATAALVSALFIQVGTNLANDYFDHRHGTDTPQRAGPRRASASGLLPPRQVRNAALASFGLAAALGLFLILHAGWPVLVIGVLSLLSGWFYTAGPRPLGYLGLGDLFVLVFFGPVAVMGTTYVIAGTAFGQIGVWMPALFLGLEVGLLSTAILVVNNLRDRPTDAETGKRTLAVRIGDRGSQVEYTILVTAAFLLAGLAYKNHPEPRLLLPLVALPFAYAPLRRVWGPLEPRTALNPALGQTALLLLVFGALTVVALLLP